jgi:GTP-binding protein Era
MSEGTGHRCGYVAIVGRPNVGKSTLLNRLLGQKISITSRKPQTTRHRILGIRTDAAAQVIYLDTPGLHRGAGRAMNRFMNRVAFGAIQDVDVVVFLVEALRWTEEDGFVLRRLKGAGLPVVLAVNKVDRVAEKPRLLPYLAQVAGYFDFVAVIPVSATQGDNLEQLEREVLVHLPQAPAMFPEDQLTDRTERFLAAEIIREKLMCKLGDEVPYRLSVEVDRFAEEQDLTRIDAVIWVERKGQKAIVIGQAGRTLKAVGSEARHDLEELLGRKVFLRTWVKVKEGWSDDERALRQMGYGDQ